MTLTGAQLLQGFSTFIDDYTASATTSAGAADGSTLVDTSLESYGDNRLVGWFIRITEPNNAAQYTVARVTNNVQATGTITVAPPFSIQIGANVDFELHQYEPRKKFAAIDSARIPIADDVFRLIVDETITTDGYSSEYSIPDAIQRGPALVYVENVPWSPNVIWNFLPNAQSDDGMSYWTTTNLTKSTYTRVPQDRFVPKYGPACTECYVAASTAGYIQLPASAFINGLTPSGAAGRHMTYAAWVYCTTENNITISVVDDSGVLAVSNRHQGRGWELLHIECDITQTNTTTLSPRISETSDNAVTFWVNNQWFYYGYFTQINSQFYSSIPARIRRDDTNRRFVMPEPLVERRQLRLVGKDILSPLGTNTTLQNQNIMEVDETTAEILYAQAAEVMFQQERLTTQNLSQVLQRIQSVRDRIPSIRMNWDYNIAPQRFTSPYMR